MGLAERDGVIVLVGIVGSVVAAIAVTAVTVAFIATLPEFLSWLGQKFGF